MSLLARLIGTWFGCGFAPIAPGTAGSLAALLIALVLHTYAGVSAIGMAYFGACCPAFGRLMPRVRSAKRPAKSSVDEVVGQWMTSPALPPQLEAGCWRSRCSACSIFEAAGADNERLPAESALWPTTPWRVHGACCSRLDGSIFISRRVPCRFLGLRKSSDPRPQILKQPPAAAIPGVNFESAARILPGAGQASVTIGAAPAPLVVGSIPT